MPQPKRTKDQTRYVKELIEAKLREGFRPIRLPGPGRAAIAVARDEAVSEGAFDTPKAFESCAYGLLGTAEEPDWSLYRANTYQQPSPSFSVTPAAPLAPLAPSGKAQRVLVIGDLHQDPGHPDRLEVLTWIARYASEQRFDRIIQVGDWSTWDSVNQHDDNSTLAARRKPTIREDLENLKASHQAFRRGIVEDYRPKLDMLLGNHEYRVERFENANPEAVGTYTLARDETFAQFGWKVRNYGELFYVEGVGFTHHPVNGAGRAYGGKTGPQRAANDFTVPVVSGHTHRRQVHDCPKGGPVGVISMVEVGCALPWGTVEGYAKLALTGWWWGVVPMTVMGGQITDISFKSMLSLRAEFADAVAA